MKIKTSELTGVASNILALKAELASVKAHAEAMAKDMETSHKLWNAPSLLAYRAANPKDAP